MPDMHPCQLVDVDFVDSARYRYSNTVDLAITPEQLFEVLEDAEAWPHWAKVITKVTWTTPLPRDVGTRRVVDMRGGLIGDEEFLLWEPPTRMAFRFNGVVGKDSQGRSPSGTTSSARPAAAGSPGPSRWTSTGPSRHFMPLGKPVMNLTFGGSSRSCAATPTRGTASPPLGDPQTLKPSAAAARGRRG